MKRWHALFSSTGLPASSISNDGSGLAGNGTELDVNEPQSSSIALEPSIRFANLKQKLQLLRYLRPRQLHLCSHGVIVTWRGAVTKQCYGCYTP